MPAFAGDPGAARAGEPSVVLALPGLLRETARDWHGLTMAEAIVRLVTAKVIRLADASPAGAFALGSIFWRAFLRGSIQAGAYVVDSLASGTGVLHR
jgi:hypothetical protein